MFRNQQGLAKRTARGSLRRHSVASTGKNRHKITNVAIFWQFWRFLWLFWRFFFGARAHPFCPSLAITQGGDFSSQTEAKMLLILNWAPASAGVRRQDHRQGEEGLRGGDRDPAAVRTAQQHHLAAGHVRVGRGGKY